MHFLQLPLELLEQIFLEIIKSRTFKRAMRLRLVSRKDSFQGVDSGRRTNNTSQINSSTTPTKPSFALVSSMILSTYPGCIQQRLLTPTGANLLTVTLLAAYPSVLMMDVQVVISGELQKECASLMAKLEMPVCSIASERFVG